MKSDSVLADRVRESSEQVLAQREEYAASVRERQIRLGDVPNPEAGIERIEELTPEPSPAPAPAPVRENPPEVPPPPAEPEPEPAP